MPIQLPPSVFHDPELPLRRTGRTTALMLELIAKCIREPNVWHPVVDHHDAHIARIEAFECAKMLVNNLNFQGFQFQRSTLSVRLTRRG